MKNLKCASCPGGLCVLPDAEPGLSPADEAAIICPVPLDGWNAEPGT
jgi:hypothetical protein